MDLPRRTLLATGVAAGLGVLAACGRTTGSDDGTAMTATRIRYGQDPSQWVDRYDVPAGVGARRTAVAVLHGGFWRAQYDASLGAPLAADLARRGFPAWNVEYRRVGDGGGYPTTFDDVVAALRQVTQDRLVVVGHSAGGQLAVWAAAQPALRPKLVGAVSQAGVLDLVAASDHGVGASAVPDLLGGGPQQVPARYAAASPVALVPLGVPVRCVHGRDDDVVPLSQSQAYVAAATAAGDDASLTEVDGDHFVLIDVTSPVWTSTTVGLIERLAG